MIKHRKSNNLIFKILILISIIIINQNSYSQFSNTEISGARAGGDLDTLAFQTSRNIIRESSGIPEKEINPNEYLLGPNDFLSVSIISSRQRIYELPISADGKITIPEVGSIDLRNKTLAQADTILKNRIIKIIKAQDVSISLSKLREFKVIVSGAVQKQSIVRATAVDRVSEVIEKAGGMKPRASVRNIRLIRDNGNSIIKIDLTKFFALSDKNSNPTVLGGDQIIVPQIDIKDLIEVSGEVSAPGKFEYADGDSLSTLIKFCYGFKSNSLLDSVEFVRFINNTNEIKKIYLDLNSWKNIIKSNNSNLKNDFALIPGDRIYVRGIKNWSEDKYYIISGEVPKKGRFPIPPEGIKLHDALIQSGGILENGDLDKSILFRVQDYWYDDAGEKLRLSKVPIKDLTEMERIFYRAKLNERVGVASVNFKNALYDKNSNDNISLYLGDSIYIPTKRDYLSVQGRVNRPGLVPFKSDFTYKEYIELAGGFGSKADNSSVVIVKSLGQQYFAKDKNYILEPGDCILVPPESEMTFGEIFTSTLSILTQLITIFGVVFTISRLK